MAVPRITDNHTCMNKIIVIALAAFLGMSALDARAQQPDGRNDKRHRHFDKELFETKINAFITAELGLTPEEAAKFIPLCNEFRQKVFEAGRNCRRLSREVQKKKSPAESDCLKSIDECLEAGIREAELTKEYYEQFKKVLPPEKLCKYRDAEHKFARIFMEDTAIPRN
ncbi:hypothetical protein Barb6_00334 [Bacteroidales bacterium Barb6]|nr:hypothetical protein Barb6_00334 [Bacteroidales bacterium Barb6]OAV75790.1 hypothetical protein Barb7_00566 [Bacteroidales bacterium Barb7]